MTEGVGHATCAGHTETQPEPWHYDFSADGYGFPQPPKFEDKLQERYYPKGRLAAAFRIFGKNSFDESVAGHITVRVRVRKTGIRVAEPGVNTSDRTRSSRTRCG